MSDFVIEGGVLEKYVGAGDDVVIPEGVGMLWQEAFVGNEKIRSVTIPDGVTTIYHRAFKGCRNLVKVTIPASVEIIAFDAFEDCTSLQRIDVDHRNEKFSSSDAALYEKGGKVLRLCLGGIEQIVLPAALEEIQRDAFSFADQLKWIDVEAGNKKFFSSEGVLYSKRELKLLACPSKMKHVHILDGVKEIAYGAFHHCLELESIYIPDSMESMYEDTFHYCKPLEIKGTGFFLRERGGELAQRVMAEKLTSEQAAAILMHQKNREWIALGMNAVQKGNTQEIFDLLIEQLNDQKKLGTALGKRLAESYIAGAGRLSKDGRQKFYAMLCEKYSAAKKLIDQSGCDDMLNSAKNNTADKWIMEGNRIIGVNGKHDRIDVPNGGVEVSNTAFEHADAHTIYIQAKNAAIDLEWLKTARFADSVKRLEVHPTWLASLIQKNVGFKTVAGGMEENPKLAEIEFSDDVKSRLVFVKEKVNAHYEAMTKIAVRNLGMDVHEVLEIFSEKMSLTMKASFLMKELEATVNSVVLPDDVSIQAYDQIAQQLETNRALVTLANMLFGGRLENIRFADTQESAPAIAVEYLLLSFMTESKRNAAVGCREMQLIDLLNKKQIQEMLEEKFDIRDNSTATPDTSCVLPFVCRLCGVKQAVHLNALYNQYARKELMEIGIRGRIRAGLAQFLPHNESNEVLLALDKDKNGLFSQAAKLRGMTEEDLRNDLQTFADNMLDSNGQMELNYGTRAFTITLMPDMTITIWDQEKKKYCKSLPKAGKTDNAEQAAQAAESLKQLKNNAKNLSAQRAKGVQEMLQKGGTIRARSWKTRFLKSTIVRTMATGVLWGVYGEKDTLCCAFAVDGNERCTDINGAEIGLTDDTQIGVVDAAQLSEEALEAWRAFFWKKGTKAVVRQFEAPARYIPAEFIEDRYMGLTVSVGYARAATDYDPYSYDPEAYIDGNFIDVSAIAQDRHQDTGELLIEYVRVSRDMPDFDDMTDHQKRLLNRDLIRLDSVLHPEKKAAEIVATGSQAEVKSLTDTHLITPDNITQMLGVAIDKKNTDAVSYLLELKQEWLGDVNDPFAEFTLD